MPHDAWRPSSPSSVAPHQYNKYGSDNSIGIMGGTVTPAVDNVRYNQSFTTVLSFLGPFTYL
jgi:hypothetical protein